MKGFWQRAYDWLAGLGKYIKKIVLDIFTDAVKTFINKMGPTIESILKAIQEDPSIVRDGDRRKTAYKMIKEAAIQAGLDTVKDSIIYMAIEMILQALKNTGELGGNVGAKSACSKKKAKKS